MKIRFRRRSRQEGAVAVMVALLSGLLMMMAAFGVDLGNAWARKQTVQKSVDVSAISAGDLLPRTDANEASIYLAVAHYLNEPQNHVMGQATMSDSELADALHDGNMANGEVTFNDDNTMTVQAPDAHVGFGFAGIFGIDSTEVTNAATVQIQTPVPPMNSVLPMWVPSTCVYGALAGDIAADPPPDASPTYTNVGSSDNQYFTSISPSSVEYATAHPSVTITIDGVPKNRDWGVMRFTFGNTQYVDYLFSFTQTTSNNSTVTVTIPDLDTLTAQRVPDNSTVTDPNNIWTITSTTGNWQVWPLISTSTTVPSPLNFPLTSTQQSSLKWPKNNGEGTYQVTGGGDVACNEHQRGNFGQLDSPRNDTGLKQTAYAENVAFGLDHLLTQFSDASSPYECQTDGDPAGALIDDDPTRDTSNCLFVDPGNDPQGLTDGLLGGGRIPVGSGRLQKPTNPACGRDDLNIRGKLYNNDTLSCYLKPGYTLADIAKDDAPQGVLDESIVDSPRFFWVPVVYAGDRQLKKYLAIKTFEPVFLTDETTTSGATDSNGITTNPAGQVQSVQIFGFNQSALPLDYQGPTIPYQPGAAKVVRLIK